MVVPAHSNAAGTPFAPSNALVARTEALGCSQLAAARQIALALDYMRAHLDQPITISTLSAMVGLTQSRLFVLFRRATGDTPLNWFIHARMQRAGELLEQTVLSIKQIAAQVGYDDPLYFSRLFKSVQGVPPTEYRARNKRRPAHIVTA